MTMYIYFDNGNLIMTTTNPTLIWKNFKEEYFDEDYTCFSKEEMNEIRIIFNYFINHEDMLTCELAEGIIIYRSQLITEANE